MIGDFVVVIYLNGEGESGSDCYRSGKVSKRQSVGSNCDGDEASEHSCIRRDVEDGGRSVVENVLRAIAEGELVGDSVALGVRIEVVNKVECLVVSANFLLEDDGGWLESKVVAVMGEHIVEVERLLIILGRREHAEGKGDSALVVRGAHYLQQVQHIVVLYIRRERGGRY